MNVENGSGQVKFRVTRSSNHPYKGRPMITLNQANQSWHLNPTHFSSWKRFTRVHAWVSRFVGNCSTHARGKGELKPSEIEDTEVQIIKSTQREVFSEEYLALQWQKELLK